MNIAGLQKNSFVDFPNNISTVLFSSGCNLDCWYCHNRDIIDEASLSKVTRNEIKTFLIKNKGFVDGVVFSGGEPTIQHDLGATMKWVKGMGFKIKLDTNGLDPSKIESLINDGLLDYIAMDVKAPLDEYNKVTTRPVSADMLKRSIDFIMNCGVDYEFRTTVAPTLEIEDFYSIGESIEGAKKYFLQQYVRPKKCTENTLLIPHYKSTLLKIKDICEPFVQSISIRGI